MPARMLAPRAGMSWARLSDIERGYVTPTASELAALKAALDKLILARAAVRRAAVRVGWPPEAI